MKDEKTFEEELGEVYNFELGDIWYKEKPRSRKWCKSSCAIYITDNAQDRAKELAREMGWYWAIVCAKGDNPNIQK